MSDPTQIDHYMAYPLCSFCTTAWDVIYDRLRAGNKYGQYASPAEILNDCKVGGCDPDIWNYIDDETGWPIGVKLSPNTGHPICYAYKRNAEKGKGRFKVYADYDNRLHHRSDEAARAWVQPGQAPYHRVGERLMKQNLAKNERRKAAINGTDVNDESLWADEEEEDDDDEQLEHDQTVDDTDDELEDDEELADVNDPSIWD